MEVNCLVFYLTVACFMEVILWLIHFLNYTRPRAILYEFIFPITGGEGPRTHRILKGSQAECFFFFFNLAGEKLVGVNSEKGGKFSNTYPKPLTVVCSLTQKSHFSETDPQSSNSRGQKGFNCKNMRRWVSRDGSVMECR